MSLTKTTPSPVAASGTFTGPLLTIAAAALAAALTWAVARGLVGDDLTVAFDGNEQVVSIASVVVTTVAAGAVGALTLAGLRRVTARGTQVWVAAASLVTLLSFSGPLSAEAPSGTKAALVALHAVVALVLIPGLARLGSRTSH